MTMVKEYLEYTKKYCASHGEKTLVLIQVGSFFEAYALLLPDGSYKGSHIQEFAAINDMIISKKNVCVGDLNAVMAGFGLNQLEKYVKKMLNHDYTVVVFTQDNQSKNTTRSLACIYSPGTFFNNYDSLSGINEQNFNAGLSNNTLCIWAHLSLKNNIIKESMLTIGLSIIDILTGKVIMYEYCQPYLNIPSTYDQLEKYVAIYNPAEVIIITNNEDPDAIENIISYANINCQKFHKITLTSCKNMIPLLEFEKIALNCEKQTFQEALIDKIYGQGSFLEKAEFHEYTIANQSLCFLLDFVERHNPYLVREISYPIFENHSNKLILANHSLKQLNIISDQRYNGKLSCVANFLNNCITNAGRRKFNYDLLHPISDVIELEKSYAITEHLLNTEFHTDIRDYLNNIKDIERIERKLIMKNINPKDFFILHSNLSKIHELLKKISDNTSNSEFYKYIHSYIPYNLANICTELSEFIESRFNLEKAGSIITDKLSNYKLEDLNFINKNYSEDLNILMKNSIDSREQFDAIKSYFSQIIGKFEKPKSGGSRTKKKLDDDEDSLEQEYIKIHETAKMDAMLIGTKRRVMILKECISEIISKNGQHIGIKYISNYSQKEEILNLDLAVIEYKIHGNNKSNMIVCSPHINEIANAIQNSKDILVDGLLRFYGEIMREFCEVISPWTISKSKNSKLSIISQFISLVDLCQCKCYNAIKYNYCRPRIFDTDYSQGTTAKSYVNFRKMRHCLIEHLNNKELYVTNDLVLGDMINGILLYGTNAVGKTSFIKSIGIAIIMAQAGMYVPCSEFIYYPYTYLFTRILGNDNIFKGLSTFAVEMCELRTILKQATQNSIILGDELCSGTESTSALSIFVSSLERLHQIESTYIFATHFHEVLGYEEMKALKKMRTYHMTVIFDREKNRLIYDRKLKEGPGESMYGLEVCKSLDLPDDFVERAYEIRNKYCKKGTKTMSSKKSKYNAKKLRGPCEICKNEKGTEIHHLQYQQNAVNGIIAEEFNKNKKANLINICEECHLKIHGTGQEYRIARGTDGYELLEL